MEQAIYIGGEWRRTERSIKVRSPWDGSLVGRAGFATPDDVRAALSAAVKATKAPFPAHERSTVLRQVEALLRERAELVASTISREAGKPITAARLEVQRALDTVSIAADAARSIVGEAIAMDAVAAGTGLLAVEIVEPVGVVAAITPFNFPLNLAMHKLGPAVAAGCPVVWKPSERTPMTALLVAQLFHDAGLPPGMVNLVTGDPAMIVGAMIDDEDVALITFTGSAAVGWDIKSRSPKKRHVLELGSNAAAYVDADADVEATAQALAVAAFGFAGQACISTQRILVHQDVAPAFRKALREAAHALPVGDPADPATVVGPMITKEARDRTGAWIEAAVAAGATLDHGGDLVEGVLTPTVIVEPPDDALVVCAEAFAPLVTVHVVADIDEAIRRINSSNFGLNTSVYTRDLGTALTFARRVESGTVLVNVPTNFRAEHMPYGGVKESGQGREGVRYAVEDMIARKLVLIRS